MRDVMPFESRRVTGVPLDSGHAGLLEALYTDARVRASLAGGKPGELAVTDTASDHWQTHGFGLWAWFDKTEHTFLGRGGLRRTQVEGIAVVELTCCLTPDAWGRGLATELGQAALLWGELHRDLRGVVGCSLPEHWRSRRVMQKLGMEYERDVTYLGAHQVLYRLA